jgi:hypothetical protein
MIHRWSTYDGARFTNGAILPQETRIDGHIVKASLARLRHRLTCSPNSLSVSQFLHLDREKVLWQQKGAVFRKSSYILVQNFQRETHVKMAEHVSTSLTIIFGNAHTPAANVLPVSGVDSPRRKYTRRESIWSWVERGE